MGLVSAVNFSNRSSDSKILGPRALSGSGAASHLDGGFPPISCSGSAVRLSETWTELPILGPRTLLASVDRTSSHNCFSREEGSALADPV
jgi:hypothetical protein